MTATRSDPLVWSPRQWRVLLALTVVLALFCTAASLSHMARAVGVLRDWPLEVHVKVETPAGAAAGSGKVTDVRPGGAGERAGLRPGDLVRSNALGVLPGAVLGPGVPLPLTVDRDGVRFPTEFVVPEQPPLPPGAVLVL